MSSQKNDQVPSFGRLKELKDGRAAWATRGSYKPKGRPKILVKTVIAWKARGLVEDTNLGGHAAIVLTLAGEAKVEGISISELLERREAAKKNRPTSDDGVMWWQR